MYGAFQYGELKYGENKVTDEDLESYRPNLLNYLPPLYRDILEMEKLQNSLSIELGNLYFSKSDIEDQLFIESATWGLTFWERVFGIQSNLSLSYEERREIIKAKIRGYGTVTKTMIKEVALAFTNAEVDVIEHPESYSFVVKFIGIKGIPKNMAGFLEIIEIIKPAHLSYSIEYTFTWWDKLKELTWTSAKAKTWNELRVY
ncbi:putative phage tail protein [Schinkia azotoformans]|uniref:putative phage tail protein n=1 Tax=Schinkia azotoformans TaxID=1454 RepID=UPI002DB95819|nr:putative phage tail protein [Schinkia azotoformans]MEC1716592.1 DUF2313 domain-containing protein [Schinkia azotoformans]MEC1739430.1 DUF2313 domain-containing protein [Schinkia azotoformans]MEC1745500.1 DUF2313 domain-containing protein [Schinkia azotoformans]MEC1756563.1 DUF2313 domain-containing protein [Schinkia azotoformans]MEC1765830.1 DUF2313 domain-containing protein [Schinkia azotoformans]